MAKNQFIRYKIEICGNYLDFLHFTDSKKNSFLRNHSRKYGIWLVSWCKLLKSSQNSYPTFARCPYLNNLECVGYCPAYCERFYFHQLQSKKLTQLICSCLVRNMDEIISRFPHLAEDIFDNLDDESLVKCKEIGRFFYNFLVNILYYT